MLKIEPIRTQKGGIFLQFQIEGIRYRFAPVKNGRFDSQNDLARAYAICAQIKADIMEGKFDKTLEKYRPISDRKIVEIKEQANLTIQELWKQYSEGRKNLVSHATYTISYKLVTNSLNKCPYSLLSDASKILRYYTETGSPIVSKKVLVQINAACNWAVAMGLLEENPFEKTKKLIYKDKGKTEADIDPFTEAEKNQIITVYQHSSKHNHYLGFVRFLFATGCRPSEAIALTWKDVEFGSVNFNKTYVNGKVTSRLKTQEKRVIKINKTVNSILNLQKYALGESKTKGTDLVFPSKKLGTYIKLHSFTKDSWNKVLETLPEIKRRAPYQMRHTFITLALKQASIQDVARHCGNSPEIILKHYAGVSRDFVMPEI